MVVLAALNESLDQLRRGSTSHTSNDPRHRRGLLGQIGIVDDIGIQPARELDVVLARTSARRRLTLELRAAWLPRIAGDEDQRAMAIDHILFLFFFLWLSRQAYPTRNNNELSARRIEAEWPAHNALSDSNVCPAYGRRVCGRDHYPQNSTP